MLESIWKKIDLKKVDVCLDLSIIMDALRTLIKTRCQI